MARLILTFLFLCLFTSVSYSTASICKKKSGDAKRPWVCSGIKYKCKYSVDSDGCSTKKALGKFNFAVKKFNKIFKKSCEFHDVCYIFYSKKYCDTSFAAKMKKACLKKYKYNPGGLPNCLFLADAYFAEVTINKRHRTRHKAAQTEFSGKGCKKLN